MRDRAGLVSALEALVAMLGYAVSYAKELGSAAGVCNRRERTIRIRPAMAPNRTVEVLIHELAHAFASEAVDDRPAGSQTPAQGRPVSRRCRRELPTGW